MKKILSVRILFIAAIVALCSFSFLSFERIELISRSSKMVTHTTQVKLELEKLISTLNDAEAGHRGYLLTHDQRFLQSFNKNLKEYPRYIASLRKLTVDNPAQQKNLQQVEALAVRRVNYMFYMLQIDKTQTPNAEQMLGGKEIMDSLHSVINKLEDTESNLLQIRNAELNRQSVIAPIWLLLFTLTALAILIATFLAIIRQIKARKKTEENEEELQRLFKQAPVTIVVYRGENFIVEVANTSALEMWGKSEQEVIGKPFFEISPELQEIQEPLLKQIMRTGETFIGKEFAAQYKRDGVLHSGYFDFVYRPTRNSQNEITGIIAVGTEVTHSVLARKKVEESEEKFRTLATEAPLFVWLTDENLQTTYLNKKGLNYFNLDESINMADLSWKKFIHPEDIERVLGIMKAAAEKHESYVLEMRLKNRLTGKYRWFLDKAAPRYINEIFVGFIGTSFDIHDQKLTQEKIKESEANYRWLSQTLEEKVQQRTAELQQRNEFIETIIDASHEWIAVWDKDLRMLTVNKAVERVLGSTREQLAGKHLFEIYPNAKGARSETDLIRALKGESIKNEPFYSPITDKYIQNYITPLKDDKGNVYAALAIAHDVTEIKKAEEDLKRSQRHFSQLFSVSPVAMSLSYVDDGQVVNVNEAWEKMFLLKRANAIGKNTSEIKLANMVEKITRIRTAGGSAQGTEIKYRLAGKIIYAFVSVESVELDGVKCFLSAYFDISERKKAEEKIKVANQLLARRNAEFLEAQRLAHIGSWEWNIAEDKISWTDELYRIFGVSPETFETTYENYLHLMHPDDREYVANMVQEAYQTHRPFDFVHRNMRPNGTIRTLHARGEVLLNEKGEPIKMFGTAQDITELKRYEAEIKQKNTELENMNRELSSFAYVASHDLQEPLRKIQILSKRILEREVGKLSSDGRESFMRMENAANRMQQLINDLLSYSRTAVSEKHFEPTDLNHLLQQVKVDLNEKITATSTVIETDKLPKLNVVPFQFKQLFTNLIHNSIKFSKPGIPPHIKIESNLVNKLNGAAGAKNKYYHIRVTDNGIGFEDEYKEQIFGLFSRLHGRSEYEGTGIGLSICKRIVENHNGIITAEGEPEKGATFNIYLPVE